MSVEMFAYFTAYKLGKDVEDVAPAKGDPQHVLELLLSWGQRFSGDDPHRDLMREIPFEAGYEKAADRWMEDAAFCTEHEAEPPLDPQTGRLIFERLLQACQVVLANQAAGERLPHPAPSLSKRDQEVATALYWMHAMELPFPVLEQKPRHPKAEVMTKKGPSSPGLLSTFLSGIFRGIGGK